MTDDRTPRSSEADWFVDDRSAARYMVAQLVFAGSICVVFLAVLLEGYFDFPTAARVVFGLVLGAGYLWTVSVFFRVASYGHSHWLGPPGSAGWAFSRKRYKEAASVTGRGPNWMLARDLAWTAAVAQVTATVIVLPT